MNATTRRQAIRDAEAHVARETDAAILGPKYTTSALVQMGYLWSYGASMAYRSAYAEAFVSAWQTRELVLGLAK